MNHFQPLENNNNPNEQLNCQPNSPTIYRLKLIKAEAMTGLKSGLKSHPLSVKKIINQLENKPMTYDDQRKLIDLLFQHADLKRIQGKPIDDKISGILEKKYTSLRYSKFLTAKLAENVKEGDTGLIGELLADKKFDERSQIIDKLIDDQQRLAAFSLCKNNLQSAVSIIEKVKNIELALEMFSELSKSPNLDNNQKDSLKYPARRLAKKVFKSEKTKQLIDLLKNDTFQLSNYQDFIHHLGSRPKVIMDMINNSSDAKEGITYALKFVAKSKLLSKFIKSRDCLQKLTEQQKYEVVEYAQKLNNALETKPEIIKVGRLHEGRYAKNKFVMGINSEDQYFIAWSNTSQCEYHRDIFEHRYLPRLGIKSGGYITVVEDNNESKIITFKGSSCDFGLYSQETLENFRPSLEESFEKIYGLDKFKLVIKTSGDNDDDED